MAASGTNTATSHGEMLSQNETIDAVPHLEVSGPQSRWLVILILTIITNFGSALTVPNYVTDAFSWPAFLWCLPPVLLATYLLFRYRTRAERVVTYAAIALGLFWLV